MSTSQKIWSNLFKFVLVVVAATIPILITSSYKTTSSPKPIGFQKSINQVPKKKKPINQYELQKKFDNLEEY